jgi:dTMP kinase
MGKGKIIVIEGACDGIGKTTQYEMLKKRLTDEGNDVVTHHFPSYGEYQGKGVEEYLAGHFGDIKELPPYFINCLYANDRAITWYERLKKDYDEGKTILLDRYTTSSLIYQAALVENVDDKKAFIDYVCDFEYKKLGIGEPDKVIFLCAPFDLVTKMRNDRKQNDGISNDLHEKDLNFMKKVYDNAVFLADYLKWDVVKCDEYNEMKSIKDIHKDIWNKILEI